MPCLVVGIPIVRERSCLAFVIPRALFQEKDNPGMGVERFLVMTDVFIVGIQPFAYELSLSMSFDPNCWVPHLGSYSKPILSAISRSAPLVLS